MRRHALFILGMHRSGASALAGALVQAGAFPGRTIRAVPDVDTSDALECEPIVALNDELLRELGTRWDGLAPLPDRWGEHPQVRQLAEQARHVVRDQFGDRDVVVVKDSRISRLAPFWREAFQAEGFGVAASLMLRRPGEVAASLARRDPVAPEKSLALWLLYLAEAERGTRGMARMLVSYDKLLDAPAGTLAHVVSTAKLPLTMQGSVREAALSAIRPDLRHQGADGAARNVAALGSGLDRVLEEGFERLDRLSPGADPQREVESLLQSAGPALTAAIPPWLAQELAADREIAEQHAESLQTAQRQIAALEHEVAQARSAAAERDRSEAELRKRIEQLSAVGSAEGRDSRIDEALASLRADVSRIAYTLGDQPAREQALRLELSQAQRDLYDERATISRLSEDVEATRNAALEQQRQLETAHGHLQALMDEVEQARAAHAARDAHEAALQHQLDTVRLEAIQLQSERDRAQEERNLVQEERDLARRERDQSVRQLDAMKPEVESLRRDLAVATKEREAIARQATEVGTALAALREELARRAESESALAEERSRLQVDLRAATERAAATERELGKRAADLTALTGRYEALARTLAAVERRWLGRIALRRVKRR